MQGSSPPFRCQLCNFQLFLDSTAGVQYAQGLAGGPQPGSSVLSWLPGSRKSSYSCSKPQRRGPLFSSHLSNGGSLGTILVLLKCWPKAKWSCKADDILTQTNKVSHTFTGIVPFCPVLRCHSSIIFPILYKEDSFFLCQTNHNLQKLDPCGPET